MTKILKASDVAGGYIPTTEDLNRVKMSKENFKLSGDGVFHTIQGEGNWIGRPTTFVRLHHCTLNCSRCDARYTWHKGSKEFYTEPYDIPVGDLLEEIYKAQREKGVTEEFYVKNVTFTG